MVKKISFFAFFIISTFTFSFSLFSQSSQNTLTITTYYPAPFGVYKELRTKRMAIGDNYYRSSDYSWGVDIDSDADLVVEGNVGIGTTNPTQKLDVNGQIHSTGDICTDAGGGKCLSSVVGKVVYAYSDWFYFVCDNKIHTAGYVECPPGTYVVGCARDNANNFGGGDTWVVDKWWEDNLDPKRKEWFNTLLIPPGSTGYGGSKVFPNGGCQFGYQCDPKHPVSFDKHRIRAICVPASGYSIP